MGQLPISSEQMYLTHRYNPAAATHLIRSCRACFTAVALLHENTSIGSTRSLFGLSPPDSIAAPPTGGLSTTL